MSSHTPSPSAAPSHAAEREGPAAVKVQEPTLVSAHPPPPSPTLASGPSVAGAAGRPPKPAKREHAARKDKDNTVNGPLYMQTANNVVLVRRLRRKDEGPLKQFTRWFVDNQIGLTTNLLALLLLVHGCMPRARVLTSKFLTLSYYNPGTGNYGVGSDDSYLIFFFVLVLTLLRALLMEYVLAPFAKSQGITKRKPIVRFSEQGFLLFWGAFIFTLGMYIYITSPYYLNLRELWTNWPTREIPGLVKAYTLCALSFWLQQLLVINIEERRKDHWQMFSHHIVTVTLIYAAYRYHFTRVANLIMILMDIVDLFFPSAKCLKYLGYSKLCDCMFGLFMFSWLIARHICYMMVVYSVWAHTPEIIPSKGYWVGTQDNLTGPHMLPDALSWQQTFGPLWKSDSMVYFNDPIRNSFLGLLLFLQGLTIVWFTMIIKVAIRVLRGDGADDTRSDDEAGEDEDEYVYEEAKPLEEEVGVEQIDLKNWERRSGVKRQAATSGVSIPGHSDRKELLGRIGCEKQVD